MASSSNAAIDLTAETDETDESEVWEFDAAVTASLEEAARPTKRKRRSSSVDDDIPDNTTPPPAEQTCPICQEPPKLSVLLPCDKHRLCRACLLRMLTKSENAGCPLCRDSYPSILVSHHNTRCGMCKKIPRKLYKVKPCREHFVCSECAGSAITAYGIHCPVDGCNQRPKERAKQNEFILL